MNTVIFGFDKNSQTIKEIIEQAYNRYLVQSGSEPFNVVSFLSGFMGGGSDEHPTNVGDTAVLDINQTLQLFRKKVFDKIILPREIFIGQTHAQILSYLALHGLSVENIFVAQRLSEKFLSERTVPENFIEPYTSAKYLPYLEFHIADHCNLNCGACEHYSGLVKEPRFPDLKKFTRDMEQLHKFIDDIGVIRILGGEPLLNPEVNEYVELCRRIYPAAEIVIVTNTVLLPKMPEDFFRTLRENHAGIWISLYPPFKSKLEQIKKLLESQRIPYGVSPLNDNFTCKQTLKPHDQPAEMFSHCVQAHCHNIYEGKIAACFLPFVTKYFNEYYGKNLPEDGALDLYEENLTTEKLKRHLLTPFERCRYCTPPVNVKWKTITHPSPISDWVNDDLR